MAPRRIISLVPSLTEYLYWLGVGGALAGRTKFCDEPPEVTTIEAVGGTKDPDVRRIIELAPDLVIANREENRREDVEALRAAGLRVLLTDPNTVPGAVTMLHELGALLEREARAAELAAEVEALLAAPPPAGRPRVFVAVWKQPLMGLGSAAYGHDLLERAGAENVLAARSRYPEVTYDEVRALAPDLILLPDEPYRFRERDAVAFSAIAPARVIDGRLVWWYGPRMPAAIRKLRALFQAAGGGLT